MWKQVWISTNSLDLWSRAHSLCFLGLFSAPKKIGIVTVWHFLRWEMESRVTSDTAALPCLCLPWGVPSQVRLPKSVGRGNCVIVIAGEECHHSSHEREMWGGAPEAAFQLAPEKAYTVGVPVLLRPPRPVTSPAKPKGSCVDASTVKHLASLGIWF